MLKYMFIIQCIGDYSNDIGRKLETTLGRLNELKSFQNYSGHIGEPLTDVDTYTVTAHVLSEVLDDLSAMAVAIWTIEDQANKELSAHLGVKVDKEVEEVEVEVEEVEKEGETAMIPVHRTPVRKSLTDSQLSLNKVKQQEVQLF
jgi:hypothetical protein